jgi:type II secretory pathway pseudopilin PulG
MRNINPDVRGQKSEVRRGFTLAEGLIAAVVLALAVGAIVAPISASYQQTQTVKQTSIAISMAQQLMDEILSKPFVDPSDLSTTLGPEGDEANRAAFDNIDDYHGYHDSTDPAATDAIKLTSGAVVGWNSTDIYRRSVTVEYRSSPGGAAVAAGDYAVVKVTVTLPHGHQVSVQRMVCQYPRGS